MRTVKGILDRRSEFQNIVTIQGRLKLGGDTIGKRFYLVRLAHGDGVRDAMPMREFAALVRRLTGRKVNASALSDIETGKRKRIDVTFTVAIAEVDPLQRGLDWLIRGTPVGAPVSLTEPARDPESEEPGASGEDHPPAPRSAGGGRRR